MTLAHTLYFKSSGPFQVPGYIDKNVNKFLPLLNQAKLFEGVWRSRDIAACIYNMRSIWRRVVRFTARSHYPRGNSPRYSLKRRLVRPQRQFKCGGKEKRPLLQRGIEPRLLNQPTRTPVAVPTELSGFYREDIMT
jgi:hypothetical protein